MPVKDSIQQFIDDLHFASGFLKTFQTTRPEKPTPDIETAEERLITILADGPLRIINERDRLAQTDPSFAHTDGNMSPLSHY